MPTLEKITISDYRNIEMQEICFSPNVNCIWGDNGEGKTNLLDAIYYLSIVRQPLPPQASQRPPRTLNEKRPGLYPRILASGNATNRLRMSPKTPVYVAGFDRGVLPNGDWSTVTTLSMFSMPIISPYGNGSVWAR